MEGTLPGKLQEEIRQSGPTTGDISNMVTEAARRQEDPATAVAPGSLPAGVTEAPVAPELESKGKPEKTLEDYSKQELLDMPQEQFDKLAGTNPLHMDRDILIIAMQRKNSR
jgi:hypothetical protein